VADIGFYGNSRRRNKFMVPHFQVVLGGQWQENAGSYGLAVGAVPSKAIPEVLDAITDRYVQERDRGEKFQDWVARLGKKEMRGMLTRYMEVPPYETHSEYYTDWGDPREFTMGDLGIGECAGEVVTLFSMEIAKAESEAFEAMVALDEGDYEKADALAYHAMVLAARALVTIQYLDVGDDRNRIIEEFRTRFYDTKLFFDKYAAGKFAQYLFNRHENSHPAPDQDSAHQLIEEAQLFIEATHSCEARVSGAVTGGGRV
jgi:sulfite reductase (ferredoxin)